MNKYEDEAMKRKHRLTIGLTDFEFRKLKEYQIQIRAPSLSAAILSLLKTDAKLMQSCITFEESNNERKESSKEKKEINKELFSLVDLRIDDASRDATNAKKKLTVEERKNLFWQRLVPYVQSGKYTREMVTDFYLYWTESNERGLRMRFEMEKIFELPRRLATWKKRDDARNSHPKIGGVPAGGGSMIRSLSPEQLQEQMLSKRRREQATEDLLRQYDENRAAAVAYGKKQ